MTDSDKTTLLSVERLGAIGAIIASLSLAASFIHDWGFFFALGISFAEAPTSLIDHLSSWLVWVPAIITTVFAVVLFHLVTQRLDFTVGFRKPDDGVSVSPPLQAKWRDPLWRLFVCLGILIIVSWVLTAQPITPEVPLLICWIWLTNWVFDHPAIRQHYSAVVPLLVYLLPLLFMFFYILGYRSADLQNTKATAYLQNPPDTAYVVRSFPNWLLIRDIDDTRIQWVRSEDIHRIELTEDKKPFRGLICILADKLCPTEKEDTVPTPRTDTIATHDSKHSTT